jgi:hypothetical protein
MWRPRHNHHGSLSAIRQEKDNKGNDCDTHDFVISTDTYNRCQQKVFRNFIVATAIENVQKQRYGVYEKQRSASATLDTAFTVPTLQFKGPKTGPAVLAVKDGKGKPSIVPEEGARVAPKSAPAAFNGLQVPDVAAEDKRLKEQLQQQEKQQKQQQEEQQKQKQQPAAAAGASAFDLKFKAPTPKAPPELGLVAPKYELVHRGTLDLQSAWEGTADNRVRQLENVPKALVVRVALPRLESIAGVELDVAPQRVLLNMPDMYRLDLALPFKVDDTEGKAKFDKGKRQLELVLPVVPPPPPQRAALSTPLSEGALVEEVASWEEQGEDEAVEAAPAASETSEASPQGAREAQVEAEAQAKVEIVSENERKWRETMARGDEKRRAAAAAAEAEALQAATDRVLEQAAATTAVADAAAVAPRLEGDFVATAAFGGPRLGYVFKKGDCGLGYYADAREASKYKKQLTTQTLQPAATPATPAATAAVSAPAVTEPKPASDPPVESKPALAPRLFAGDVFELD